MDNNVKQKIKNDIRRLAFTSLMAALSVGAVNRETFEFELSDPIFPYAGNSKHNQKG